MATRTIKEYIEILGRDFISLEQNTNYGTLQSGRWKATAHISDKYKNPKQLNICATGYGIKPETALKDLLKELKTRKPYLG